MDGKVQGLKADVGAEDGDRLARLAVEMIVKTGDRLLYSPFAQLHTGGYSASIFPKVRQYVEGAIFAVA